MLVEEFLMKYSKNKIYRKCYVQDVITKSSRENYILF